MLQAALPALRRKPHAPLLLFCPYVSLAASIQLPAELDIKSMETMRGLLASPALGLSPNLPVFNTEAGILQDAFAALGNNHTYGAGFLARTFLLNWALGVQHCCWYAFDAGGLVDWMMW